MGSNSILMWACWIGLLLLLLKWALERFKDAYVVKWFRPISWAWRDQYDWEDIRQILRGDPLKISAKLKVRGLDWRTVLGDVTLLLLGLSVLVMMARWIFKDDFAVFFNSKDSGVIAVVTLAIGLYTAARQLHSKVRSENRQKWIENVRDNLAQVLGFISVTKPEDVALTEDATKNLPRLKLELLLNPSEKDHRTLGVLLRKAFGFEEIEVDRPVLDNLSEVKDLKARENGRCSAQLISCIIRLSNAMLKREWELVKHGR